jgi:hypothetical protein
MPVRFTKRRKVARWKPSSKVARILAASGGKVKKPRGKPEHDAQVKLFAEHIDVRLVAGAVAFAIPNGGFRHKRVAAEMKAEGQKAGVLDIYILHQRQSYFLEMKSLRGSLEPEQKVMMARLQAAGAVVAVAKGLDQAIRQLEAWHLLVPVASGLAATETGRMAA